MVMAFVVIVPAAHAATGVEERSAPITVLLVGIGAVVGVVVGLVPALVVAILLGYLPPPRLAGRRGGVLVEPARAELPSAVRAPLPSAVARAAPPTPPTPAPPAPQPPSTPALGVLAQARHQSVYDAAYAEQAERVDALRAAIGGRLRKEPSPPGE
ncbi:hypothetical protein [Baekduia sp. Peel2402]|uniref:hypothetical protein n=1 Tax=Baekduia sp. Peel2402 TaxID=3458296 RepID=UPI00403E374F